MGNEENKEELSVEELEQVSGGEGTRRPHPQPPHNKDIREKEEKRIL